jgi:hypothetical protein
MQIINVLMSLGLVAFGLMLVITGIQFGAVILIAIATALTCAFAWIKEKLTGSK